MSKWQANNNYAVVEMLRPGQVMKNGLHIPETLVGQCRWGRVQSVGKGVPDYNAEVHAPEWPKAGQLAYVMNHGRHDLPVWLQGESEYSHIDVASVLDILAVWIDEENKLQPLGAHVEVELIKTPEVVNGIIVPEAHRPVSGVAVVKTVGKGWRGVNGKPVEFQVEEGQTVAFQAMNLQEIDLRPLGIDESRYVVSHGSILAVLKDDDGA